MSAPRSASDPRAAIDSASPMDGLLTSAVWATLLARWFVPTEGTALGDTLWLSTLTFGICGLWLLWNSRTLSRPPGRSRLVISLAMLVLAQVLSALVILGTEGQKRPALNLLWEWLAIGMQGLVLRESLRQSSRRQWLTTVLAVWLTLAAYGIWQHHFWYQANWSDYQAMRQELSELEGRLVHLEPSERKRMQELQAEFVQQGVPLSATERGLFERRLRDSTEPPGFFALANSYAGPVAVLAVLLTGLALRKDDTATARSGLMTGRRLVIGLLLMTLWCLQLTKSRTAFCGAAAGIALLLTMQLSSSSSGRTMRRVVTGFLSLVAGAVILFGIGLVSGAVDTQVLSEAPRSLRFRLEYWSATASMIADHPWLGVGPGQFRDHYLNYRLPGASEEIADPHQMLLDVAASAGLPGLLALLTLLTILLMNAVQLWNRARRDDSERSLRTGLWWQDHAGALAVIVAVGLVAGWQMLVEAGPQPHVLTVGLIAAGVSYFASRSSLIESVPTAALLSAQVALMIHLLGAGGIAMPAVTGLLVTLGVLTEAALRPDDAVPQADSSSRVQLACRGLAGLAALLVFLCGRTSLLPVLEARGLMLTGDYEVALTGRPESGAPRYRAAAAADPLSYEPWLRLAELEFRNWDLHRRADSFDNAVQFAEEARQRAPFTPLIPWRMGVWYRQRAESDRNEEAAHTSVGHLKRAVELSPTNALWRSDLAFAQRLAGQNDEAGPTAARALELDELNRRAGHIDKYLSDDVRSRLEQILKPSTVEK